MEKQKWGRSGQEEQNLEAIARLFPSVMTERRGEDGALRRAVDLEALKALLAPDVVEGEECYEFTWVGENASRAEAAQATTLTLRPVREDSRDWETTRNLYIEGENLDALKVLRRSYQGKVSLIYLDPPYNTGHDFVYRDRWQRSQRAEDEQLGVYDEEGLQLFENTKRNGRFHSDWCSILYARLLLARDFLAEDGLIFLSIGEEEVANLRKLCDEVFGEANFRNQIIVRRGTKSVQAQFDTWDRLGQGFEYILFYSKSSDYRFPKQVKDLEETKPGSWNNHWRGTDRPTMRYPLFGIQPATGQWRWSQERSRAAAENYQRMLDELGRTEHTVTQEEIDAWYARQEEPVDLLRLSQTGKPEHYVPSADSTLLNSSWMDLLVGSSSEIKALFGERVFDTAKLTAVIQRMLRFAPKDALVMDFFSGSATTAQAVMQQNAEDGGSRRFLLIQAPEPCHPRSVAVQEGYPDVCALGKERIRRAGDRLRRDDPAAEVDIGFRVFRVDESVQKEVAYPPEAYTQEVIGQVISTLKEDRTDWDLLYWYLLDHGMEVHRSHTWEMLEGCTVHWVDQGKVAACLEERVPAAVIQAMAGRKPRWALFRGDAFSGDAERTNVNGLFQMLTPNTEVVFVE